MKNIYIINEKQYSLIKEKQKHWEYYDNFKEYRSLNKDETYFYLPLPTKVTGLKVPIYLDDEMDYIAKNHPLWLYFENGINRDLIPMSISKNPQILIKDYKTSLSNEDIYKIRMFIIKNYDAIIAFSNREIDLNTFYFCLKRSELFESLLCEMPVMTSKETGLPTNIWVDKKRDMRHGPRIKFQADKSDTNTHDWPTITISDKPIVKHMPSKTFLSEKDIKLIKQFIIYNLDLLKFASNDDSADFEREILPNIIRIGKSGGPLYPSSMLDIPLNSGDNKVGISTNIANEKLYFIAVEPNKTSEELIKVVAKNPDFSFETIYSVSLKEYDINNYDYLYYMKALKKFQTIADMNGFAVKFMK